MAQQSADNCPFPPVIELLSVDSTNNYALSLLKGAALTEGQENIRHGAAVFAHEQFAGKGQRGKTWQSGKGENIHLSIIVEPTNIEINSRFLLIAAVALAVRGVFERYACSDIFIKWPNDIYFQNRKAGGILIENIISGARWKWAVAGIGLNINQTGFGAELDKKAVSLKQITGGEFDCLQLAKELRNDVLQKIAQISSPSLMAEYNRFLFRRGKNTRFEKDGQVFEAVVKEVIPSGQLAVNTDIELHFDFGEVSWVME